MGYDRETAGTTGLGATPQGAEVELWGDDRLARVIEKPDRCAGQGAIYLLGTVTGGFCKIGWVRRIDNVPHRIAALQAGCPYRIQFYGAFPDQARRCESVLHKRFSAHHFRGEWFRCEGDMKDFAQHVIAYPDAGLDEVLKKMG